MIIPLGFFLWGIFSLNSYGVNNDEPFHFTRGQAYLNLYLTGSRTYDNLSGFNNWAKANNAAAADLDVASVKRTGTRFSAYQNPTPAFSAETLMTSDVGHPPLPDILAAASNKLFYQNLGWLGDVPSYHLFEISIATLGVILVVGWAYLEFGLVAAVIAGLALALHPMYLGESRFNIKDPAETVFFAATIFSAWFVIRLNSRKGSSNRQLIGWLLMTGAMFACAIDTKFNAFFVLPILGLWFAFSLIFSRIYQSAEDKHPFKSTLKQWLSPVMLVGYLLIAIVLPD